MIFFVLILLVFYIVILKIRINEIVISGVKQKKEQSFLLDVLIEGVVLLDSEGAVLKMNKSAQKLLGDLHQKVDKNSFLRIRTLDLIEACLKNKKPVTDSVCIEEGRKRYFDVAVIPYEEKMVAIIQDKSNEQKVSEVGKGFVANASHELKTPITIIRGFAETLQDMVELPKEMLDEILEKIIRNCKRMDSLVRNLLTLSDIENVPLANRQACDLVALVEESKRAILSVHPKASVEIIQSSEAVAEVDPSILELAIVNVLENAVKYSNAPAKITVSLCQNDEIATVSIQDQGVGISSLDLEHIFDRFYTVNKAHSRKLGGAGLGLSLVKTIIEKHDG
ncbi:MAG: histidine kinase, partial [Verrucomicrobia bacterium]|nr:histidine kinase [Verrucomicrobiota bacterium]